MKPLITLILFFCTSLLAIGQEYPDSGFTDKAEAKNLMVNGKKEGKWCEFHASINDKDVITKDEKRANAYYLTVYKAGIPYGVMRIYWVNNNLIWLMKEKSKYKNGWLYRKIPYSNGQINGVLVEYDPEETSYTPYKDGKKNGISKVYYCSKQGSGLKWEITYVNDTEIGTKKLYYQDGKLQIEFPAKTKGKMNGTQKFYSEKGILVSETTYKDDKIIKQVCYDANGNKVKCLR